MQARHPKVRLEVWRATPSANSQRSQYNVHRWPLWRPKKYPASTAPDIPSSCSSIAPRDILGRPKRTCVSNPADANIGFTLQNQTPQDIRLELDREPILRTTTPNPTRPTAQ